MVIKSTVFPIQNLAKLISTILFYKFPCFGIALKHVYILIFFKTISFVRASIETTKKIK